MNNHSTPDYTVGFTETPRVLTLLKVLAATGQMLSEDIIQWLTPTGVPRAKGLNTLSLLIHSNVIEQLGVSYKITVNFSELVGKMKLEGALQESVLASIRSDDLELFIKNGKRPDRLTIVWNVSDISPFQVNLRELLLSLDLIRFHHGYLRSKTPLIRHLYRTGILADTPEDKKLMSNEDLLASLELKRQRGEEAEVCALGYETRRLSQYGKTPKKISDVNVAAGYDILSYVDGESENYDRYIEVKYFNNGHFYISRNELEVSRQLRDSYWIYLVNIYDDGSYEIEEMTNVYEKVMKSNEWEHVVEVVKVWKNGLNSEQ